MSRKRVPAALHSELSEYASLLRALRTNSALDLTEHLIRPSSVHTEDSSDSEDDLADDDDVPVPSTSALPPRLHRKGSSKGKSKQVDFDMSEVIPSPSTQKRRDTWTRWPLLAGDVHVPEWNLEDEVKSLAVQTLSERLFVEAGTTSAQPEIEVDDDEIVPLDALVFSTSEHLAHLLSALAAHFPLAEKSMQNRVKPIAWKTVLDVAASSGFADAKYVQIFQISFGSICHRNIQDCDLVFVLTAVTNYSTIERVRTRMENIYEPSESSELNS
ncbi:hypothetical protein NEOLEDRAFT_1070533 [Neolentinus lepideus HHB14362 ss-1]|uniref:Uncharacterized protein n=1 Tax=Neolentinus lepideus HHB14362 ss-1 TaxID=1314782 RepID=A0A165QWD5_9AGAM|nr:hypothetical protein NEOLEDRAFT_1070533 [Neolentinus lepideus HHB14362 ss-1]